MLPCRLGVGASIARRIGVRAFKRPGRAPGCHAAMGPVVVRSEPGSDNMTITLELASKVRNMDRPKAEDLARTLQRISLNAAQGQKKAKQKKAAKGARQQQQQQQGPAQPSVALYASRDSFERRDALQGPPGGTSNEEAWRAGAVLCVGEDVFDVDFNPPTAKAVAVLGHPMVGYPLLAAPTLVFADAAATRYQWFRSEQEVGPSGSGEKEGKEEAGWRAPETLTWQPLGGETDRFCTPSEACRGRWLRVECTPARASEGVEGGAKLGEPLAAVTAAPVGEGPPRGPADARHALTQRHLEAPQLRVVSYNILADQYASTEHAQKVLFANCPPRCLAAPYRRALLLREILGFHADLVALQEVDQRAFEPLLLPHLQRAGYEGFFSKKAGSVLEGSALFYRRSRFRVAWRRDLILAELLSPILGSDGPQGTPTGTPRGGLDAAGRESAVPSSAEDALRTSAAAHPGDGEGETLRSVGATGTASVGDGSERGGEGAAGAAKEGEAVRKLLEQLRPLVEGNTNLRDALGKVSTVAQLAVLIPTAAPQGDEISPRGASGGPSSSPDAPLCVLNTHLYFHPRANHIRAIHAAALLAAARDAVQEAAALPELGGQEPALLFCGDLNSDLNDDVPGVVELLQSGRMGAGHPDWAAGAGFSFSKEGLEEERAEQAAAASKAAPGAAPAAQAEPKKGAHAASDRDAASGHSQQQPRSSGAGRSEGRQPQHAAAGAASAAEDVVSEGAEGRRGGASAGGVDLQTDFELASADGLQFRYTNYVKGYSGLLDYVWYEPRRMRVLQAYELPGEEELQGWLPSCRFPSDHLSIVFDLEWQHSGPSSKESAGAAARAATGAGSSAPLPPPGGSPAAAARESRLEAQQGFPAAAARESRPGAQDGVVGAGSSPSGGEAGRASDSSPGTSSAEAERIPVDAPGVVEAAQSCLAAGRVVAVPTDTLYGLAADARSAAAVAAVYAIKGRRQEVPLAICVADVKDVTACGRTDHLPEGLLARLLPGAVTLLLERRPDAPLSPDLNPGVPLIGIRVPDAAFIRAVCRAVGAPLALTSANPSGGRSPLEPGDFRALWPRLGAVFDAGRVGLGDQDRRGSTIVDLSVAGTYRLVRGGSVHNETVAVLKACGLRHRAS